MYWIRHLHTLPYPDVLVTAFAVCVCLTISCGDDGDDEKESTDDDFDIDDEGDDDLSDDEGDDNGGGGDAPELCEDVWVDDATGLLWQKCLLVSADLWYDVGLIKNHCDTMEYAGYDDWRMPTIDELRSLIVGCQNTQPGGECGVTNECYDKECRNDACDGCTYPSGPIEGCFQNQNLNYSCYGFWSPMSIETVVENTWYEETIWWYIDYGDGGVMLPEWYSIDPEVKKIRCVRSIENESSRDTIEWH